MADATSRFELRMDSDLLRQIDRWREKQADLPSRANAVRRLTTLGLSGEKGKRSFEFVRFGVLTASLSPAVAERFPDAYVFAWDRRVYPINHHNRLHECWSKYFEVTEAMCDALVGFLGERWDEKKVPTFYELEEHFEVRLGTTGWDRLKLMSTCRYMYLSDSFDTDFWKALLTPMKHPTEAKSIVRPFERECEIFFA